MNRNVENAVIISAVVFCLVIITTCVMCISGTVDHDVFKSYLDIRKHLEISVSITAAVIALLTVGKWVASKSHQHK